MGIRELSHEQPMGVLLEFEHTRYGGITSRRVLRALDTSQLSKLIGD